jgi:hypothetical protein
VIAPITIISAGELEDIQLTIARNFFLFCAPFTISERIWLNHGLFHWLKIPVRMAPAWKRKN